MDHIEPRVHDEIKDYREKFYNFTLRQWIFGILIVLTTVPLYLILSPKIGSDLTGWIVIVIAIPIGFFGFIPVQGLPAEKIIFYWKRNYINFSKPIVYKSEEDLLKEKQNKKQSSKNNSINKKELKNQKKQEILKQKEQKKERKKQREIARAKRKFGVNQLNASYETYTFSQEEAQVLMKLANMVVRKENTTKYEEPSEESKPQEEKGKQEESNSENLSS